MSHDPATDRTRIVAPDMRYVFRMSWFCWFPEVPEADFQGGRCGSLVRDGTMFVVGFEHWALYDSDVSNPGETDNFGILTVNDDKKIQR